MSVFVEFSASVEVKFVCTGWFYLPFELEYPHDHCMLASMHWRDPLPLVLKYFLIENLYPSQSEGVIFEKDHALLWNFEAFLSIILFSVMRNIDFLGFYPMRLCAP